jgi:hypothetical protein
MAQIPILSGAFSDEDGDFRVAMPRNMVPVAKEQGISGGYLRPGPGIEDFGTGPGTDRASIRWNDVCYRVMGTKLVSVDQNGSVTTLGDVGGSGQAQMDYSFDRLSVQSSESLYYWDGSTLTQVTDTDLGDVVRHIWIDGYFMSTDGTNLVVTELLDPTDVDPLKYGSSEIDPDPVKAVLKLDNEPVSVGRYTMETYRNIGGNGFPYQRNEGAQVLKGSVGSFSCCVYNEAIAFVGGGRGEGIGVYMARSGDTLKISTEEVDTVLEGFTESQLEDVVCETKINRNFSELHVRLPDRTLVYDANTSSAFETPVWYELTSGLVGRSKHLACNMVWCYKNGS